MAGCCVNIQEVPVNIQKFDSRKILEISENPLREDSPDVATAVFGHWRGELLPRTGLKNRRSEGSGGANRLWEKFHKVCQEFWEFQGELVPLDYRWATATPNEGFERFVLFQGDV